MKTDAHAWRTPTALRRWMALLTVASASALSACGGGGTAAETPESVETLGAVATAASVSADGTSGQHASTLLARVLPVTTTTPVVAPVVAAAASASARTSPAAAAASAPSITSTATATPADSPWGVAPSAALSYNPEHWLPAMAAAGVTTVRGFHRTASIDRLPPITAAGMEGVGFLMWSPDGPLTLPVNDLPGWRAYVTDQVTRYKGRVKHWEVWNEAPNFTADTSPVSYARVLAAAYDAAKAVDPSVQIGLAVKSNHVAFLAEAIAAGAANKFDFITLHPYELAGLLPQGWEGMFMGIVPGVRKMLADLNPERLNVPVWFTEIGIPASAPQAGGVGPEGQAHVLVKVFTMAVAQGVARTYWFDPQDSEGLNMGLLDGQGKARPAWHALKALTTHLGARPQAKGWLQPAADAYGFVFETAQGVVLSAWAPAGQTRSLSLASDVTRVDPTTGSTQVTRSVTLGAAPVLLVAPTGSSQAAQWLSQAAANQGQAFPWGGVNRGASTVSLTAGGKPKGLFLLDPPPVTYFNGAPEFNAQGRVAFAFAVDPEFLSYTNAPVKLTVVLRRHGAASAGFNVKYEARVPISATDGNVQLNSADGWHTVAGTQFYERTWTLPNTRFVGLYGHHFRFDSDGPEHANYSVHKVTVSR